MNKIKTNLLSGFTLTELMVVISIMTMLMSVALFNFRGFSERISLSRASEEVMLSIREAQVYGTNVQETVAGSGNFSNSYGVYFNPYTNPNNFLIFADLDGNDFYDPGNGCGSVATECLKEFDFSDNVKVYQVCSEVGGTEYCSGYYATSVVFSRPSTDANINLKDKKHNVVAGYEQPQEKIKVFIRSKNELESKIVVEKSGQVYLQ